MADYDLVHPLPSELDIKCPICFGIVRDPQLTQCCGHHFCLECLQGVLKDGRPCPLCQEPKLEAVLNKSIQRTIKGLIVYCPNKSKGCTWQGEIRAIEGHMQGDCNYVSVDCANGCGQSVERHHMKEHEDNECPLRPNSDPMELSKVVQSLVLENRSLNDKVKKLVEANSTHQQEMTQLKDQTAVCQAEIIQLKQQIRALAEGNGAKINLESTGLLLGSAAISTPATPLPVRIVPYEFVFSGYKRYTDSPELWFSPPFYTHLHGYKMCIRVAAQGIGNGENTHVSVHFYLMKGVNDDQLKWPFRGFITVRLLNQLADANHYEQTTEYTDRTPDQYCRRVTQRERANQGWGKSLFVPKAELGHDSKQNIQYLKDDCLKFCVIRVHLN